MLQADLSATILFIIVLGVISFIRKAVAHSKQWDARKKEREMVPPIPPPVKKAPKKPLSSPIKRAKKSPEEKRSSPLRPGWKSRASLREAFILSQVFKRYDED